MSLSGCYSFLFNTTTCIKPSYCMNTADVQLTLEPSDNAKPPPIMNIMAHGNLC